MIKIKFVEEGDLERDISFVAQGAKSKIIEDLEDLKYSIKGQILERLERGSFRSGALASEFYSRRDIMAFKLGDVYIEGKGEEAKMTINGKQIDREDWSWGRKKNEKKSKEKTGGSPPTPLFLGGYEKWRRKYNFLRDYTVNLNFTGDMIDSFDIEMKSRGYNQYKTEVELEIVFDNSFQEEKAEITNEAREWLYISQQEFENALNESGFYRDEDYDY